MRIGLIGAGQMGTDVVATTTMMKGVRVVVAADIDLDRARDSYRIGQVQGEVVVAHIGRRRPMRPWRPGGWSPRATSASSPTCAASM